VWRRSGASKKLEKRGKVGAPALETLGTNSPGTETTYRSSQTPLVAGSDSLVLHYMPQHLYGSQSVFAIQKVSAAKLMFDLPGRMVLFQIASHQDHPALRLESTILVAHAAMSGTIKDQQTRNLLDLP